MLRRRVPGEEALALVGRHGAAGARVEARHEVAHVVVASCWSRRPGTMNVSVSGHASEPWPPRLEVTTPMWMSSTGGNVALRAGPGTASSGPGGLHAPTGAPVVGSTHVGLTRPRTRSGTATARICCLSAIDRELSIIEEQVDLVDRALREPLHDGRTSSSARSTRKCRKRRRRRRATSRVRSLPTTRTSAW